MRLQEMDPGNCESMLDDRNLRFDLFAIGLLALSIFLGLSLLTYSSADPLGEAMFPLNRIYTAHQAVYPLNSEIQNACGHAGAMCADILLRVFGIGAYYVLICVTAVAGWLLMRRPVDGAATRLCGWLISLLAGVTFVQMFAENISVGPVIGPGGYLGAMGRTFLESNFATVGSLILLATVILGGLMLCTDYVLLRIGILTMTALLNAMPRSQWNVVGRISRILRPRRRARTFDEQRYDEEVEDEEEYFEEAATDDEFDMSFMRTRGRVVSDLTNPADLPTQVEEDEEEDEYETDVYEEDEWDENENEFEEDDSQGATASTGKAGDRAGSKLTTGRVKANKGDDREEVIAQLEEASREQDPQDYELPTKDLLHEAEHYNVDELTIEVKRKAALLEKTFEDFNLDVKVVDIETGPVIAQYEVALKRGLRLSKITGLSDDLAIALRVPSVRIVAPIPGKNTVGIEVPNDERQVVRLREVMNETNGRIRKMSIPIFLGKDVSGNPLTVDLAKLPHLLIAGRTGTGKSVCLNSIISSILMTKTPDDVRLLMIDPKMVELSGYSRLPHLMHPVVTDMRKAEAILAWACEKMDERYQLLARAGVRHISSYNQLGEEELMERLQPESEDEAKLVPRHLPFIVIVADEMADLMMTAGKEVEGHIIRLAAKSRAVGIHLILATQKPTVDVITGLIKSNLPARIAFQVASKNDSRVVLDENGADKLLGYGDLLFLSPGTSTLLRGQGTFMSDDEIDRIVDYCGSKGEQNFVRELVQLKVEEPEAGEVLDLKKRDELYEEAIGIVVREGRGSVSLLQRNLQIGYGRAARLIDFMAEDGIVGAYNGSQAREVLMTLADWEASQTASNSQESAAASPHVMTAAAVSARRDDERTEYEEERVVDELEVEEELEEAELDEDDEFDEVDDELDEEDLEDEEEMELEEEDDDEEDEADNEDDDEEVAEDDEEEWEEVDDEGEEYEPEDFDGEEYQNAVKGKVPASDEDLAADDEIEYEDVEDFDELAEAETIAGQQREDVRDRARDGSHPHQKKPRNRGNTKIFLHRSHAE